jgi:diguanylate cyclase (GGDEF)-like protein
MSQIALTLLQDMEIAIFERRGPYQYQLAGLVPEFYGQLFPDESNGEPCQRPWDYSPMLEFFMPLMEEFFEDKKHKKHKKDNELDSGVWMETPLAVNARDSADSSQDIPLVAMAKVLGSAQVLILQCVRRAYSERARVLRQARNELLERRKVNHYLVVFKKKSLYDTMTNLYNHGAFMDILNSRIENHKSYHSGLALLFIDIDNFKKVNDTYGHLAGDSVLIQLGEILRKSLRKNDVPARYGGEEFAVLAARTTLQQGRIIGEKLRRDVEQHDFGIGKPITISIGVSIYKSNESADELIDRSDQALYEAKNSGKNKVVVRMPWGVEK